MKTFLRKAIQSYQIKSLFLAASIFCSVTVSAQISFLGGTADNVAGNNSKKLIFKHTVSTGTNFLVVTVTAQDKQIKSVQFGQQSLTAAITQLQGSMYVAIYYLINPAIGSDLVTVESISSTDLAAGASSYGNVDVYNPILETASAAGKSSSASLNINSTGGYTVVDGIGTIANSVTKAATQTLATSAGGSHPNASSYKQTTGASTTRTSWTLPVTEDWAMVSIVLKAALSGGTLPIKLSNFDAKYNKPNVELTWTTEQEINFSHFIVEKSTDGINYTTVANVFGAGNSTAKINYQFTDKTAGNGGIVYYRLKSVDRDDMFSYSTTRIIRLEETKTGIAITSFPNPVSNELRITIPTNWQNRKVTYELFSINGIKISKTENANSSQTETVNVTKLNAGVYIVVVTCNGESAQQRIIKY